ncbi:acyl-CoA dehydrogenase family protein [Chitinophaga nivalis]|uniref:Acyl-CoA dehydrogenase family protein n=1 Tax=Chitinophaga nivalis TaxID=2991709 RepID=A0ABT3IQX4_9BACT|nr:acyl-CoA dehydrogenase family protein [Chitinophaga nivalis]MCW3463924.1 acyl-CoA dehydrogenase family protein [Chitinophaga nivalis]MCW3486386.1 acyl-CoA dehydrogenase family protein [Chitinophaga nivalis]
MALSDFDFLRSVNQVPALEDYNSFTTHAVLQQLMHTYGAGWMQEQATAFGHIMGSHSMQEAGNLANKYLPVLKTHDRYGNRLDVVEFHPAYHEMMTTAIQHQVHTIAWTTPSEGGYLAHSILSFLKQQIDEGTSCPLTMTFAAVPSLKLEPHIAQEWLPLVLSNEYDARHIPYYEKKGVTIGMAMTEPQGGSDVRANLTIAKPVGNGIYHITGRKWFCSAPMSDAFLVLAQTDKGLSCLLVPRFTPDGEKNKLFFQRLKDKLGNKSNASGEVEFHGAWAQLIGEEGRGVASIMEMVRHTRLDCAVGSAATLQRALVEVIHHCQHRSTFGKKLIDQPLMKNVLADLCLESEAATTLAMRLAKGFDDALTDEGALYFTRITTAVAKFWNTKRAVLVLGEAMESMGGNGYVEESILPRLYRDVPVNAIWEGSGNIQALDVLRAMQKEPQSIEVLMHYFQQSRGLDKELDQQLLTLQQLITDPAGYEYKARIIVEKMALAIQAIELIQVAPPAVAELFCQSRLSAKRGLTWGTMETPTAPETIIHRIYREV